ncbi:MAG: large conductance mechanosensitive channel protein MscL [Candidatus Saccharibacteria bacterium]
MQKNIDTKKLVEAGESQLKSFVNFIRTQGVVGLAVGLVLGGAVGVMVKSLVDNIVMPPLGLLLGSTEGLKGLSLVMGNTSDGAPAVLHYGIFLNDFINFVVIALVIYIMISMLKIEKIDKKK